MHASHTLAESLVSEGEMALLKGDFSAIALFDQAEHIEANDPDLFHRQGLALFEYGSEEGKEKALHFANKKFKLAASLKKDSFHIWQAWGNTLFLLGKITGQHRYFIEASEKYQKATTLAHGQSPDLIAELYWDYGAVWMHIGEKSGEALDDQLALDAFQKASSFQEELSSEFWHDYGHTALRLAPRINDTRLYVKAINCFKHALSMGGTTFEGWKGLGIALEQLYSQTHDEDHFSQANECFQAATGSAPEDAKTWLHWARFLCDAGRRHSDVKRLRACIEKCHRAYVCDSELKEAVGIWAEALALLGVISDRLDLIYEAQNKIAEVVTDDCNFNDAEYYFQAIEQFQLGLSINRAHHKLWYAQATTYATIAQMGGDLDDYQKAIRFFNKAIDLSPSSYAICDLALVLSKLGEITHDQRWLEEAIVQFERALSLQKNAVYLHPEWLFHYASTLDMLGDFYEEETHYLKAIEILSHVLMIDPDFPSIHYRIALVHSHLGDLTGELDHFERAAHYYRLASKHDEDNDQIIDDWGVTLINIAERSKNLAEVDQIYRDAEHKLSHAAKLGNKESYYHLACLYSLLRQYDKGNRFLEKADAFKALPSIDEMMQDDWLDGLRMTEEFRALIAQIERRPSSHQER
jgi:tetratricopeptide (TPR) repeat protein